MIITRKKSHQINLKGNKMNLQLAFYWSKHVNDIAWCPCLQFCNEATSNNHPIGNNKRCNKANHCSTRIQNNRNRVGTESHHAGVLQDPSLHLSLPVWFHMDIQRFPVGRMIADLCWRLRGRCNWRLSRSLPCRVCSFRMSRCRPHLLPGCSSLGSPPLELRRPAKPARTSSWRLLGLFFWGTRNWIVQRLGSLLFKCSSLYT